MKLNKPSYQIIEPTGYTIDDIYKSIELAGKVSHKSEHTIKEGSAKEFVDRMIKLGHGATLEFGTVYLKIPAGKYSFLCDDLDDCDDIKNSFFSNPYTKIHCQDGYFYISTNYRVLIETFSQEFISELVQYLCEPAEHHEKRVCVKFILDRGILAEFTRHRTFSFIAESSRYCNYSKDRFGNELTFIQPCWITDESLSYWKNVMNSETKWFHPNDAFPGINMFLYSLEEAEDIYLALINEEGWKPQEARVVLPLSLKTELYMCGFVSDWEHFFRLRTSILAETGKPHPDASALADPLYKEFIERGLING